jgi:hypothetical protein
MEGFPRGAPVPAGASWPLSPSESKGELMTATTMYAGGTERVATPTERLLQGSLLVAPLIYLAADSTYAAKGWDDATAGVLHVLGAIAYGFVVLAVASWLPGSSRLASLVLLTGLIGMAGNVAYGFDTIHMSLGDVQLVDRHGAANLIKPLGLFFPLSMVAVAAALHQLGRRWQAGMVLVAALAWPIGHIANVAEVAVAVNIGLLVAFGSLALAQPLRR